MSCWLFDLAVIIEKDGDGYLAKYPKLPMLYGYGDTPNDALFMLEKDLNILYSDLLSEEKFGEEWARVKDYIGKHVIEQVSQ